MEPWHHAILTVVGDLPFDQQDAGHAEVDMFDRELSDSARSLIVKLLERDPAKRIDARSVLNHALRKTVSDIS